jgi:broad specificity phosphatase PhoE
LSVLFLIRHGQASFLGDNYDQLSPVGEEQARLLGRFWDSRGLTFHRVYTGPAERQIRTAAIAIPGTEAEVVPELDEFPAEAVFRAFLPPLTEKHSQFLELVDQLRNGGDRRIRQRAFDAMLREVSQRWLNGEFSSAEIPTWQDFCARIETAVRAILDAAPKSSRIAVFTSAGPVAATARLALGLSYESTMELTWTPKNASVTEFLFTPGRFSLSTYNETPHLAEERLITYR